MELLNSVLGDFYFQEHGHCPPTFLQVVGWTSGAERPEAKKRYVYVRKVPLKITNSPSGGRWDWDWDIIKEYYEEITEPVKNHSEMVTGNAILIPGGDFLRYQSITVPRHVFDIPRSKNIAI